MYYLLFPLFLPFLPPVLPLAPFISLPFSFLYYLFLPPILPTSCSLYFPSFHLSIFSLLFTCLEIKERDSPPPRQVRKLEILSITHRYLFQNLHTINIFGP
uniref:Uncharacterized protein n=1 Tax=Cacopsylla melanoneura TaxID=428564 RepID=A0A8D8R3H5_9HEMI